MHHTQPILLVGSGRARLQALQIFKENEMLVYGLLGTPLPKDTPFAKEIPWLGSEDDPNFLNLLGTKASFFVAFDRASKQRQYIEKLGKEVHASMINAIHPMTSLSTGFSQGVGNQIDAFTALGVGVTLGSFNRIGMHVTIGAGVQIGDHVTIGDGARIAAGVTLSDGEQVPSGDVIC